MQSLAFSFNIVFPMFLLMAIGYLCRVKGIITAAHTDSYNKLIHFVLLPAMLFESVYSSDLSGDVNVPLLLYLALCVTATVAALVFLLPRFVKRGDRCAAAIQGVFRGNSSIFGISLALLLYKDQGLGVMSFMICLIIILYGTYATLVLEWFRGVKPGLWSMLKSSSTNPLILSVVLGLVFKLLSIPLPMVADTTIHMLGSATTAIGFLLLGASFTFVSARKNRRLLTACVLGKLVLFPLLWILGAILLGYRGQELGSVMILLAAPTALSSFPLAKEMGADADLAGEIVVFTSAFSIITVFVWIFVLGSLGLI